MEKALDTLAILCERFEQVNSDLANVEMQVVTENVEDLPTA